MHIPEESRGHFHLCDSDLKKELIRLTDAHTDELFLLNGAHRLVFPISRLVVDPERFENDQDEPMAERGMGVVYTKTHDGRALKSDHNREILLETYYRLHHKTLREWVEARLEITGRCLIIDCHSFPSSPLPCDLDQNPDRPDFCIGTCKPHTSDLLEQFTVDAVRRLGLSVEVDQPYAGTIVPTEYLGKDPRVSSLMIEVNRRLYMNEITGTKSEAFPRIQSVMSNLLSMIASTWKSEQNIHGL